MTPLVSLLVAMATPIIVGSLMSVVVRRIFRRRIERRPQQNSAACVNRCRCGYDLTGVAIPRCPECGRAIGFDKTFEELGLTETEVFQLVKNRRLRERDASAP